MSNAVSARRAELYSLLGDLPPRDRPITATSLHLTEGRGYALETLVLDLNGIEPVPAYFVTPLNFAPPYPVILYQHAHGSEYQLGKDELIRGRSAIQNPPYAEVLTQAGFAALCIDHWCFGERRGKSESATFKEMLWRGQVLWGMMVYDSLRAVDYLTSRTDVDSARIGTLGLSMGSTLAWWSAALDDRIKVCVDICCMTDYQALIDANGLDGHGVYYYVPSLLNHFTTAQINSLTAPRPHLSLAGDRDPLTPSAGLDRIDTELKAVYAESPAAWEMYRSPTGHYETAAMRDRIMRWLAEWL